MKNKMFSISLLSFLLILACDLPHQPGPMPKHIIETEFVPGLNILGVLRADGTVGSSFIDVNRALTTEEIYSDSIHNFSPELIHALVTRYDSGQESYFRTTGDSFSEGSYQDTSLLVQPGKTYDLEIQSSGFPTLTATTLIPAEPQVVTNSLLLQTNNISFKLNHHDSAFEYKMFLIFAESTLGKVIKPGSDSLIFVDWGFDADRGLPAYLILTSLDENLTRYGNSPISFIPNTYHLDGSTVSGGYGCFGSVAVAAIEL